MPPGDGPAWVGVDVGTQSLRVLVVDDTGVVLGRGSERLTSHREGARHEQDPEDWWRALGSACRQALAAVHPGRLRGMAVCGTSGTFLLAGPDGTPRTPAVMYDDGRARDERLPGWQPSWALPKLVWLLRHGPAALRADAAAGRLRLLHCPDLLAARLAGAPVATDYSHALKTGYDLDALQWPATTLDPLGVPVSMLPDVVRPGTGIGRVGPAGTRHTGLPEGLPIRAGMTDGCAAQIAAGTLRPGSWNSVLGTTLVVKGVTVERLADPDGAVYSHRHPDGGWLPGGASNVGAGAVAARFPAVDPDAMDRKAAAYEPAGGISYPLVSRGERFPFVHPGAEPFDVGEFADDADRYAAVLQGVGYTERLCYASLRRLGAEVNGPVALTGGGTRSRYWCQLRADILGRAVTLPAVAEPAMGMAVLASAGDGALHAAASRRVRSAQVIEPRPGAPERFDEPYARFVDALADRGYLGDGLARYVKETR